MEEVLDVLVLDDSVLVVVDLSLPCFRLCLVLDSVVLFVLPLSV